MGTNYYWHEKDDCSECGRPFEPRHIGKSSAGWCFSLHVYPDEDIQDLPDWEDLWKREGSVIRDEYGKPLTADEMRLIILARTWSRHDRLSADWYAENHAEAGPAGLARHQVDGWHCIKQGNGTYDLCIGDFS